MVSMQRQHGANGHAVMPNARSTHRTFIAGIICL